MEYIRNLEGRVGGGGGARAGGRAPLCFLKFIQSKVGPDMTEVRVLVQFYMVRV